MKIERPHVRIPPDQRLTTKLPTLTCGPLPHIDLAQWRLEIDGPVDEPLSFMWEKEEREVAPAVDVPGQR